MHICPGFPGGAMVKNMTAKAGDIETRVQWVWKIHTQEETQGIWKISWRRAWQLTQVFLPGKSRGQRSLAGYSPWYLKESDMTEARDHVVT